MTYPIDVALWRGPRCLRLTFCDGLLSQVKTVFARQLHEVRAQAGTSTNALGDFVETDGILSPVVTSSMWSFKGR